MFLVKQIGSYYLPKWSSDTHYQWTYWRAPEIMLRSLQLVDQYQKLPKSHFRSGLKLPEWLLTCWPPAMTSVFPKNLRNYKDSTLSYISSCIIHSTRMIQDDLSLNFVELYLRTYIEQWLCSRSGWQSDSVDGTHMQPDTYLLNLTTQTYTDTDREGLRTPCVWVSVCVTPS